MTEYEISMPFDGDVSQNQIIEWCRKTFGEPAVYHDRVSESLSWCCVEWFAHTSYYFYRESDVVLFKLKWC